MGNERRSSERVFAPSSPFSFFSNLTVYGRGSATRLGSLVARNVYREILIKIDKTLRTYSFPLFLSLSRQMRDIVDSLRK